MATALERRKLSPLQQRLSTAASNAAGASIGCEELQQLLLSIHEQVGSLDKRNTALQQRVAALLNEAPAGAGDEDEDANAGTASLAA